MENNPDFVIEDGILKRYTGPNGDVTIPDGVTKIGFWAFRNCTGLTSVTIPEGVTEIEFEAFRDCTDLTSVTIPASVTEINWSAFQNCTGLTSITIPEDAETITKGCFEDTPWFKNLGEFAVINHILLTYQGPGGDVVIPEGVTEIEKEAFKDCTGLTSVTIPESVKEIGENAFQNCTDLTSVTILEGVTKIGEFAFGLCENLRSVHIPKSVESLGFSSFSGCHGLEELTIDEANPRYRQSEGVVYVGDDVLFCLSSQKGVVTVEPGTTKVGFHAFEGCPCITEIRFPDSVTSIGAYAFQNCVALERLALPPKLKKISAYTAQNCPKLTEVVFPENLSEIGKHAFENTGLRSVTLPEAVKDVGIAAFFLCDDLTEVTLKGGKTALSKNSFGISPVKHLNILGNGVSIAPSAFSWENMETLTAEQMPLADLPKGQCRELALAMFCRKRLAGDAVPLEEEYLKYIKSQRKKLFPLAVREEAVLLVLLKEKMLVRKDIDPLLEECDKQNNVAAKAAVLEYAGKNLKPVDPLKEFKLKDL